MMQNLRSVVALARVHAKTSWSRRNFCSSSSNNGNLFARFVQSKGAAWFGRGIAFSVGYLVLGHDMTGPTIAQLEKELKNDNQLPENEGSHQKSCGNTPLDEEARIKFLEDANKSQIYLSQRDISYKKKCTVYSSHPSDSKEQKRRGIVLWVPQSIEELVSTASEHLNVTGASSVLTEDEAKIIDVDLISDGQKLYLTVEP